MDQLATGPIAYAATPVLESLADISTIMEGVVGHRINAAIDGWLLAAPDANPAMTEMLADRDRSPDRDLVPWAGEFVGKYLIGAIQVWRMSGDERLGRVIVATVTRLLAAQQPDGYLGPFNEDIRLVQRWDVWGHYHIMLALLMYHDSESGYQGNQAFMAAQKIGDLMHRFFVVDNHCMRNDNDTIGEMNHAMSHGAILLYQRTGLERYKELADWIENEWDDPEAGQYMSSALAAKPIHEFPGRRWESAHSWQAIAEFWFTTGSSRYRHAFEHIWWSILEGDRHNTGGFTSGEACQGNPYHQGAIETCCTMAWIALSIDMLRVTGDSRIADEVELSTLNGMIGSQHPSGRWYTYNTPMDGTKKASQHDIVFQARAGSPEFNCCSANATRGLGMIRQWALMSKGDGVTLNYYGPCTLRTVLPIGTAVHIEQETTYPLDNSVLIHVKPDQATNFPLSFRIPEWSKRTTVRLNGETIHTPDAGRYLTLDRTWRDGDTVQLDFDFRPHVWVGEGECAGKVSIYRGPVLLTYDPRYDEYDSDALPTLDLTSFTLRPYRWDEWLAPWMLVRLTDAYGKQVVLCDFASAGATGTTYKSWLPVRGGMTAAAFSRDEAVWCRTP
jgi:uncharacterized protein